MAPRLGFEPRYPLGNRIFAIPLEILCHDPNKDLCLRNTRLCDRGLIGFKA